MSLLYFAFANSGRKTQHHYEIHYNHKCQCIGVVAGIVESSRECLFQLFHLL